MKLHITSLLIFCQLFVIAQNDYFNNQKYWKLRFKLKNYHTKIGDGHGNSLIAGKINLNHPYDTQRLPYSIEYGDGIIYQGWYLAVLATEYKLLKKYNLPTDKTIRELYYALKAIERLDHYAEDLSILSDDYYWDENSNSYYNIINNYIPWEGHLFTNNINNNLNGFLIRDDTPPFFFSKINNEFTKQRTSCAYLHKFGSDSVRNCEEISIDQILHLNLGLHMVMNSLPNNIFYNDENISDLNANIAFRNANQFFMYPENQILNLINPATQNPVKRGSNISFYAYPFFETIRDILINTNTSNSTMKLLILNSSLEENPAYFVSKAMWIAAFQNPIGNETSSLISFFLNLFPDSNPNDFWHMALVSGALSNKMSQFRIYEHSIEDGRQQQIYFLLNQFLYPNLININYWSIADQRELLNEMCCERGGFLQHRFYGDTDPDRCLKWYQSNMFIYKTIETGGDHLTNDWANDGFFPGLDYMLLHNLFYLVHPTVLESQFENHEEVSIFKSYPTPTSIYQGFIDYPYNPSLPALGNDDNPHTIRAFKSVTLNPDIPVYIWNTDNSQGNGNGNLKIEVGETFSTGEGTLHVDEGATLTISEAKPIVCDDIYGYIQQQRKPNIKPELLPEVSIHSREVRKAPELSGNRFTVNKNSNSSNFSIFPNPVINELNLSNLLLKNKSIQITIFSSEGKQVLKENLIFTLTSKVDVSQLNSGFYILKIETNNGHCETSRFIKQ